MKEKQEFQYQDRRKGSQVTGTAGVKAQRRESSGWGTGPLFPLPSPPLGQARLPEPGRLQAPLLRSICFGSRPSGAVRASSRNPIPVRPSSAPPLSHTPAPASGLLHCRSVAQNTLPQPSVSLAIPLPSPRLRSLLPSIPATCHPIIKTNPCVALPSHSRLPPVGFMALFLAKALLPFSRFLKLTYFNCLFSVPHARPGRQADLSLFASLVCLAGPGEGGG